VPSSEARPAYFTLLKEAARMPRFSIAGTTKPKASRGPAHVVQTGGDWGTAGQDDRVGLDREP